MKNILQIFLLFIFIIAIPIKNVCAQNRTIDSLLILIKTDKADTNQVNYLNRLCREYIETGEYDSGLKYGNKALALANSISIGNIKGWNKGVASAYNNIGILYMSFSNYPEALKNYLASLKVREELGDNRGVANSYNNIGIIYFTQHNFSAALKNYFASLKIKEELGDKQSIASSYNNIGVVYQHQGNYPEALKYHFASLKIEEKVGDKRGIAITYKNIGDIYQSQGNNQEALKYLFASLKIKKEIGDKDISGTLYDIGNVQIGLHKLKAAKEYFNKGLAISRALGTKYDISTNYQRLAILDSMQSNWKAAYLHHKLFIVYKDSIENDETNKKILQSTMNYEFEKKAAEVKAEQDKKDAVTVAEKKKQRQILILVSCVLLLVFVFAGFIFRSLRITRKQKQLIETQKEEVSKQKEEADSQRIIAEELRDISEQQKELVEEKQKEIVASITYAKRIQTALLTSDEYIKEHLPAEHFILFKPKDIVSGDFYWGISVAPLPGWDMGTNKVKLPADTKRKNTFYMVTADCTGHGVPGAFMSMLNISYLHENIVERGIRLPNDILNAQRKEIIEALNPAGSIEESKDGMDCTLCVYDFDKMLLHFAAANNPLWIVREKSSKFKVESLESMENDSKLNTQNYELLEYKADKMPVGKYSEKMASFTLQTIPIQKGDLIYTSTDGFADQFGGSFPSLSGRSGEGSGKKLMKKKFKEELLKIHHLPMNEQRDYLNQFFESWKGSNEQVDDVCVMGVRIG